jgi:hypothetical protein
MKRLSRSLFVSEVAEHRKEGCAHYEECLEIAAAKNYRAFSCKDCEDFEQKPNGILVELLGKKQTADPNHLTTYNEDGTKEKINWVEFGKEVTDAMRRKEIPMEPFKSRSK